MSAAHLATFISHPDKNLKHSEINDKQLEFIVRSIFITHTDPIQQQLFLAYVYLGLLNFNLNQNWTRPKYIQFDHWGEKISTASGWFNKARNIKSFTNGPPDQNPKEIQKSKLKYICRLFNNDTKEEKGKQLFSSTF